MNPGHTERVALTRLRLNFFLHLHFPKQAMLRQHTTLGVATTMEFTSTMQRIDAMQTCDAVSVTRP